MISEKGKWQLRELLNQDCQDLGKWREGGGSRVRGSRVSKGSKKRWKGWSGEKGGGSVVLV